MSVKEEFEGAAATYDGVRRCLIRIATLGKQLLWLREADFTDISTWYRYYNFVVFSGMKPLTTPC